MYGAAGACVIGRHVPNVEVTAEVTAASVDNLKLLGTAAKLARREMAEQVGHLRDRDLALEVAGHRRELGGGHALDLGAGKRHVGVPVSPQRVSTTRDS